MSSRPPFFFLLSFNPLLHFVWAESSDRSPLFLAFCWDTGFSIVVVQLGKVICLIEALGVKSFILWLSWHCLQVL
jgi:hypothetical protein